MRIEKHFKYLKDARNCAELSTCIRRGYGAVLVKNDRPISSGYNGSARGMIHCCDVGICWREHNQIPHGERYEECVSIHAEENCMYRADWEQMQGATMYLFGLENGVPINARPCKLCEKRIRTNGVSKVICGNSDGTYFIMTMGEEK